MHIHVTVRALVHAKGKSRRATALHCTCTAPPASTDLPHEICCAAQQHACQTLAATGLYLHCSAQLCFRPPPYTHMGAPPRAPAASAALQAGGASHPKAADLARPGPLPKPKQVVWLCQPCSIDRPLWFYTLPRGSLSLLGGSHHPLPAGRGRAGRSAEASINHQSIGAAG